MTDALAFQALLLTSFRDLNASGLIHFKNTATATGALSYRVKLTGNAIGPDPIVCEAPSAAQVLADARQQAKKARLAVAAERHARMLRRAAEATHPEPA